MKKAATESKPWRKRVTRRRRPHPLNGQKKLGPKEAHSR
jgi:hypothetical protein